MVPPTTHSLLLNTRPSLLSITASYQMSTPAATADADPIPTLTTNTASTTAEKTAALKLIADSVAQQRQTAAKSILFHQYALAALVLVLALQAYWLSPIPLMTSAGGTIMIELVAVRYITRGYIFAAETINWNWLLESPPSASHSRSNSNSSNNGHRRGSSSNGHKRGRSNTTEEPVIVVTKWGEEIIGALVIRVSKRERKAYVRAWTVLRRYRGKGVGRSLLEEGVKRVMGKAAVKGVEFEEEHASMFGSFSSPIIFPWGGAFVSCSFGVEVDELHSIDATFRSVADMPPPVSLTIIQIFSQDRFADNLATDSIRILPPPLNTTFDTQEDRARDILDEIVAAQKTHRRGS